MNKPHWSPLNEQEFDALLESSLAELPPEDIVAEVTPWKRAMNRVLAGMALSAITLNFLGLDYILPAVGMMLSLLGFRALRRENPWFRGCWAIILARAVYFFPLLALNTTILSGLFDFSRLDAAMTAVNLLLIFAERFCLWRGMKALRRKAGLSPKAGAAGALMVWYVLMCLLAAVDYSGWILMLAMLAAYVCILRSIYRLYKELDQAGYAVQPMAVRITDRWLAAGLALALALACAAGYIFGGSYPMDWSPLDQNEHSGLEQTEQQLLELGFPEYVLKDLTAEDIAACNGALRVVVDVTHEPVNDGRTVTNQYTDSGGVRYVEVDTVYDDKELCITGVAVQLPGDRESWMIFHHFLWEQNPGFYGTESVQLWPVYRDITEGWSGGGNITGRVLCDREGRSYAAPYYFLGTKTFTSDSLFWGQQTNADVFGAFSMPRDGENCRGYVAYTAKEAQDGYIISSWINYTHQRTWAQYPAVTAMEKRMTGSFNGGAFKTVQDALQFFPTQDAVEMIE